MCWPGLKRIFHLPLPLTKESVQSAQLSNCCLFPSAHVPINPNVVLHSSVLACTLFHHSIYSCLLGLSVFCTVSTLIFSFSSHSFSDLLQHCFLPGSSRFSFCLLLFFPFYESLCPPPTLPPSSLHTQSPLSFHCCVTESDMFGSSSALSSHKELLS